MPPTVDKEVFHPTALKFVARSGIVVKDRQLQSPHFEVLPVVILQLQNPLKFYLPVWNN